MSRLCLLPLLVAGIVAGCADSTVSELGPQNEQVVTSQADSFTYIASNLENVSDKVIFQWPNSKERVQILHQSFLPHGYGLLIIKDAVGTVVDSTLLEYQLETLSLPGAVRPPAGAGELHAPGGMGRNASAYGGGPSASRLGAGCPTRVGERSGQQTSMVTAAP